MFQMKTVTSILYLHFCMCVNSPMQISPSHKQLVNCQIYHNIKLTSKSNYMVVAEKMIELKYILTFTSTVTYLISHNSHSFHQPESLNEEKVLSKAAISNRIVFEHRVCTNYKVDQVQTEWTWAEEWTKAVNIYLQEVDKLCCRETESLSIPLKVKITA